MNTEFIPYEQALNLKELGFDEPCFAYYNIDPQLKNPAFNMVKPFEHIWCLPAPLYQQVFRWFREKHNLDISINTVYSKYNEITSKKYSGVIDSAGKFTNVGFYDTYEEAELACLKKLIEIVKDK